MKEIEIKSLINADEIKRYKYFIKKVSDFEEVWGLYLNGWAIVEDVKGEILFPIWPKKEFAEICNNGVWNNYKAKSIKLVDFIEKWIPGLKKDKRGVVVFMTPNEKGIKVNLENLQMDIEEELENY